MALQPTLHRFRAEISDVDRAVYASIDLRVARHASETARHLWARMLGYCLFYEEGLELCAEGIAHPEDPAAYKRDASGWHVWLEVGTPSAERLHKASKASGHVVVVVHTDPAPWLRELQGQRIHKAEGIEVLPLDVALLDALIGKGVERQESVNVTVSEGTLYLEHGGVHHTMELKRLSLVEPPPTA